MQFRELYAMCMPVLLPSRNDFLLHAADTFEKLADNLGHAPNKDWLPRRSLWERRHPFSPWPGEQRDFRGGAYTKTNFYWVDWLEYFQWPHVQVFHGLPHLLTLVRTLPLWQISHAMAGVNEEAYEKATSFWRAALPGLVKSF